MSEQPEMLRMVGDYGAMRRAVNGARRIWVATPWGLVRVTKRRYLRSTLVPREVRGDALYEWWQYSNGDISPIAEIHGEVRRCLTSVLPGDRIAGRGVYTPGKEGGPDNGQ